VDQVRGRCITFAALALLVPAGSAFGDEASTRMQVSAIVLPDARIVRLDAPTLVITAADLERGYLDVVRRYEVRSNAPDRLLLQFFVRGNLARSVEVRGLGAPLAIGPLGGQLCLDPPGAPGRDLALGFRIQLDPDVVPGIYPLPVVVSIDPVPL
jgi:hypothetical protein